MKFTKMHGAGNDYIYINCFTQQIDDPQALAAKLSDRHFGVGGDGVILVCPSRVADARMAMYNADGSEGRMCGNGIRCVAKFVYEYGIAPKEVMTIETLSGIKTLWLSVENGKVSRVTVDMGEPELTPQKIPMAVSGDRFVRQDYEAAGMRCKATAVSMGNPHCVIFTQDIDALDLERIGPAFENHPLFPQKVNTEFVEVVPEGLKMRVWERGSGETLACGTGACAVLVAAHLNGLCGKKSKIFLRGGVLEIEWREDGHIYMTGPAETVFEGETV